MNNPITRVRERWTEFLVEQKMRAIKKELAPTQLWEGGSGPNAQVASPWLKSQLSTLARWSPQKMRALEDEVALISEREQWDETDRLQHMILGDVERRAIRRAEKDKPRKQREKRAIPERLLSVLVHPWGFLGFQAVVMGSGFVVPGGMSVSSVILRVPIALFNVGVAAHLWRAKHTRGMRNWARWMSWVDDRRESAHLEHNKDSREAALMFSRFWTVRCALEERNELALALEESGRSRGTKPRPVGVGFEHKSNRGGQERPSGDPLAVQVPAKEGLNRGEGEPVETVALSHRGGEHNHCAPRRALETHGDTSSIYGDSSTPSQSIGTTAPSKRRSRRL